MFAVAYILVLRDPTRAQSGEESCYNAMRRERGYISVPLVEPNKARNGGEGAFWYESGGKSQAVNNLSACDLLMRLPASSPY
jgi:hypothetical protein